MGPDSGPRWPGGWLTPSLLAGPSLALALAPGCCWLVQSTRVLRGCSKRRWPRLPQPLPRCLQPRRVCAGPWLPLTPLLSAAAGTNPCSLNNGDCSQLCLPTSETSRSCMCTAGYSLKSGQQSCEGERACPHPLTRTTPLEQRDLVASPAVPAAYCSSACAAWCCVAKEGMCGVRGAGNCSLWLCAGSS